MVNLKTDGNYDYSDSTGLAEAGIKKEIQTTAKLQDRYCKRDFDIQEMVFGIETFTSG